MGTVYDYLNWRGDLAFSEAPLNEVDCMIFSMISYLDYQGIVPSQHDVDEITLRDATSMIMLRYPDCKRISVGVLIPKNIGALLRRLKDTKRFRTVKMRAYVNEIDVEREKQFSALTFLTDSGTAVVTYRGTDDTLVGWKEDLNMCYLPVVPSQTAAVEYLQRVADAHSGPLVCTGHSKGGNLAVYAAVKSPKTIRKRIKGVYSNEGPGFGRSLLDDPVYMEMRPLIHNLVPQSSVVGILLEHDDRLTVVKSRQTGLLQHNGLTWEVMGRSFVHLKNVTPESRRTDRTVNQWIKDMTPKQRAEVASALYQLFSVEGVQTLTDFVAVRKKWIVHTKKLDPKVRETLQKMLGDLLKRNGKSILTDVFGNQGDK